jgi:hypothetical protein
VSGADKGRAWYYAAVLSAPDHLLVKVAMATRQERIDAFTHEGVPPTHQPLEILCEDHVGTYVIPFLCRWNNGV